MLSAYPPALTVILSGSEESWYAAYLRQSAVNTGRREGCRLAAWSALRIISTCHVVHPLPLRGIPLKGTQDVTGLASRPTGHSGRSEESWYAAYLRQSAVNTSRWEGCRLAAWSALRIISTCHVVHPLPLRGIPLKGTQDVTGLASCPHSHSERSEESWYATHMRQSALNTGQREGCRLAAKFRTYPQGSAQLHSGRAIKRKALLWAG